MWRPQKKPSNRAAVATSIGGLGKKLEKGRAEARLSFVIGVIDMAMVRSVESRIRRVEGFDVVIRDPADGHNVRSDRGRFPAYEFSNRAAG